MPNVKVSYKVFGDTKEYTQSVTLESIEDYNKLIKEHAASSYAFLWSKDLNLFKVNIVSDGLVQVFAYNKKEEIMALLNNPATIYKVPKEFPVELSDVLLEELGFIG